MGQTPAIRIKNYLNEKGIKQSFLASRSGINDSTLNAKLNGAIRLNADDIELICAALECEPNNFLRPKVKGE